MFLSKSTTYMKQIVGNHSHGFWLLCCITLCAIAKNFYVPLCQDEAYYWEWSRHLDWSYFDGPSLTAYFIRICTFLFGHNIPAIKLSGVICTSTGIFFMFQLARQLFNQETAYIALTLFVFSPVAQQFYFFSTLDPTLFCFWSISLYYFYRTLQTDKTRYRYITAISLGLTCLAKYTGVLLIIELLAYLALSNTHRKEFKNIHWYFAAVVGLIILGPILVWNWQHDFISLAFQYHHGVAQEKIFHFKRMFSFILLQLIATNPIFLIAIFYYLGRNWKNIIRNDRLLYLALPFLGTFFFFFYESLYAHSNINWPLCAYVSASILLAHDIVQNRRMNLWKTLIVSNIIGIIVVYTLVLTGTVALHKNIWDAQLISKLNAVYHQGDTVITDHYGNAAQGAFHLEGQPQVFILGDTNDAHEYQFWNADIQQKIRNGVIKSALFMTSSENLDQIKPFFKHSELIARIPYTKQIGQANYIMSIYRVS